MNTYQTIILNVPSEKWLEKFSENYIGFDQERNLVFIDCNSFKEGKEIAANIEEAIFEEERF